MEKTIAVLGGDRRMALLARLLAEDGHPVQTWGLAAFGMEDSALEEAAQADRVVPKSEVKSEEKPAEPALLPEISYDDFAKLDLRLAKVIACEEVKKSKKLLKCTLQMGGEERIVLSGIKKWYSPEQLIGKTVVVAANLAPKTICGIESHGMILCASDASDENLSALTTMGDMASGLKVR